MTALYWWCGLCWFNCVKAVETSLINKDNVGLDSHLFSREALLWKKNNTPIITILSDAAPSHFLKLMLRLMPYLGKKGGQKQPWWYFAWTEIQLNNGSDTLSVLVPLCIFLLCFCYFFSLSQHPLLRIISSSYAPTCCVSPIQPHLHLISPSGSKLFPRSFADHRVCLCPGVVHLYLLKAWRSFYKHTKQTTGGIKKH